MSIIIDSKSYREDLKILNLSNSNLTELSESIDKFPILKVICLTNNKLKSLHENICNLSSLEELYVNQNDINKLPLNINKLINLRILNLSNNNLETLPDTIYNLPNLRILNLSNNNLNTLPESIYSLPNLNILIMKNNNLKSLSGTIYPMSKLRILDVSNNKIKKISENIKYLQLVELNLHNNKLVYIPLSIKNIIKLCIDETSYSLQKLSYECEILIIQNLKSKLDNLPSSIKEIHLYNPVIIDIKLPLNCLLYINGVLCEYLKKNSSQLVHNIT